MNYLYSLLDRHLRVKIDGLESQSYQIVRSQQIWNTLHAVIRLLWLTLTVLGVLWYLEFVLERLPWTRALGHQLLSVLINPLRVMGGGLLAAIPDLVFLAMVVLVTRFALKALRMFFAGVAGGAIKLGSFDADWAWPTYRLVKILVFMLALVVAFPYIPGSSSDAFKGVSVFIGVVFSLGSSSVIANIIAGYSMIYRRTFKLGDRIQIGEHVGDVVKSGLLVTHLNTSKNEEIVVPNSLILNGSVVNYSTLAHKGRLILHTTVGIGYETPWRQVEAMLLQAAQQTEGVQKEPAPFVLQKSLGDFCIVYEINAYCDNAQKMNQIYTALHRNILDVFNENATQIMTPAYVADPADAKYVPRERWFVSPAKPTDG